MADELSTPSTAGRPNERPEPHAITRARERYGLELTTRDLAALARQCLNPRTLIRREARNRFVHLVEHEGTAVLVGTMTNKKGRIRIQTFLKPGYTLRQHQLKGKQRRSPNKKRFFGGRRGKREVSWI